MKKLLLALFVIPAVIYTATPAKRGIKRKTEEIQTTAVQVLSPAQIQANEKFEKDFAQAHTAITTGMPEKLNMPKEMIRLIVEYLVEHGVVFDLTPYITSCEELDLSKHCIREIVVNPRRFPDVLWRINLSGNLLKTVPSKELADITSLREIDLEDNLFDEEGEKERVWLSEHFKADFTISGPHGFALFN